MLSQATEQHQLTIFTHLHGAPVFLTWTEHGRSFRVIEIGTRLPISLPL